MGKRFYRRRMGAGDHIKSGEISFFDDGLHDFICMEAQHQVGNGSPVPPGIWIGSARTLWFLSHRQDDERKIRRSLEKLTRLGWYKRWHQQGETGDYPILINRLVVRDKDGNDFCVNAEDTTDWKHPVLVPLPDPRRDVSVRRPRGVREVSGHLIDGRLEDGNTLSPSEKESYLEAVRPLATLLAQRILENNPKSELRDEKLRERRIKTWTIDLEMMVRLDGWTKDEIQQAIEFTQNDSFWRANILSAGKLRAQRDQLRLKMQEQKKGAMSRAEQRTANNLRNLGLAQN